MSKDIVIVGHGGFAREVKWLLDRINANKENTWNFLGYVDDIVAPDVFGNDTKLISAKNQLAVVIAIGTSGIRKSIFEKYSQNKNIWYPNIVDTSVLLSTDVNLGQGNIICAGSILTVNVNIGNFNIINLDCTVGHDAVLEDFITVNPSVNLSGNTHVEDLVNIGTGTQVIQGKTIGRKSIIGAGAVVNQDIPPRCTAVGVPARPIKFFE